MEGNHFPALKDFLNLPENVSRLLLWDRPRPDPTRSDIQLLLFYYSGSEKTACLRYLCQQGLDLTSFLVPNDQGLYPLRFENWYKACIAIGFEFDDLRKTAVMNFLLKKMQYVFAQPGPFNQEEYYRWFDLLMSKTIKSAAT